MSAIHTLDQLSDALAEELSWRKKELSILKRFVVDSEPRDEPRNTAVRSGIALLYAHWEGFIKNSGTMYLEYVGRQYRSYRELKSNFAAIGMRQQLQSAIGTSRMFALLSVTDSLVNHLDDRCTIGWSGAVQTKSNLDPERFKEIVLMLGLDYSHYATKEKLLEQKLVKPRHEIAHGKYLQFDHEDFYFLFDEVLALMQTFRNQIENAAYQKEYRS
jgi:hypothetical protein